MKLVKDYGPKNWAFIAKNLPGRTGKAMQRKMA